MKSVIFLLLFTSGLLCTAIGQPKRDFSTNSPLVKTAQGTVEGVTEKSGIRAFKGIPFAAPPVGQLRWKEPQPPQPWKGVRKADKFGPRAMQRAVFGDMNFRSNGMSEDCLYLNVWTPAKSGNEKLPVLVYYYGGGYMAGDGSEPRYDGENMAQKGIVTVTVNYRLGVFGFLAHPELTKESSHKASGNYGLMDQSAALRWVQQNIAAFGGDSKKITIAGESAGSSSVSAQMASPLSRNLIAGAIGESGSLLSLQPLATLAQAEEMGLNYAKSIGAATLEALRNMPADQLLETTAKPETPRFRPIVDGYFLPDLPVAIFQAGQQAHVPLLAGWNSEEANYRSILGEDSPTVENYEKALQKHFGEQAGEVLKLYPATTQEQVMDMGTQLASDRGTGFSTWKWIDLHSKTGGKPVYRYFYTRPRPPMTPEMGDASAGMAGGVVKANDPTAIKMPPARGAVHSAEIEYAMGNLSTNKVYSWTKEDYKVSETMQAYFANFIKTGNPNGGNLPKWSVVGSQGDVQLMKIDVTSAAQTDQNNRYQLLEQIAGKKTAAR
ncbi:carboxylesterase family protein [Cytophagaceae bacterium YF14B1]|uniref:Carboxylic ester hydrolase n=1 Tax=Xanthocytophaga flava TaxID=3048013 RepID=A0AAE3QNH7_9BACT|nr:carboxylesterase family protein [Xanthocytophaga flavus]MDJ1482587.1 carboxylesterase family protein [Xanthocytophaga flavus]